MGKRTDDFNPDLFPRPVRRSHAVPRGRRSLIIPRYLQAEASRFKTRDGELATAHEILIRWADLEIAGALDRKETSLDADFLNEVFGTALGYATVTQNPESFHLQRQYTVPGEGTPDGVVGS